MARVLIPGGYLLLAFQTEGEPVRREDAFGTRMPLTSYRHSVRVVVGHLENMGFKICTTAVRAPELEHKNDLAGIRNRHWPTLVAAQGIADRTVDPGTPSCCRRSHLTLTTGKGPCFILWTTSCP